MRCERCGKEKILKPLSVFGEEEIEEHYICEECLSRLTSEIHLLPLPDFAAWIYQSFRREEADQLFAQRCRSCGQNFLAFLFSPSHRCPQCYGSFALLFLTLWEIFERQTAAVPKATAQASSGKPMAAHVVPSQKIYEEPRLRLDFLKERFEALIHDEKYEEAGKLSEQMKNLKNTAS